MKKAIVTGAAGFVGRHLTEYLRKNGVTVYAVLHDEGKINQLPKGTICICDDLADGRKLSEKLKQVGAEGAEAFYHLAWNGVAQKYKNDVQTQIHNIDLGITALDACHALECNKFINTGTVAEYTATDGLICPSAVPTPNDIYGASKVATRYILTEYARNQQQQIINTILGSTYGEYRLDGSILSYTIETLLRGETPSFGNLQQLWNFVYADDVACGLYLIGERGNPGKTYAIGTEERRPLYEYILIIKNSIDPALKLNIGVYAERFTRVRSSCVDITDLQKDTGFTPKYDFEHGIKRTISWMKNMMAPDEWKKNTAGGGRETKQAKLKTFSKTAALSRDGYGKHAATTEVAA